MHGEEARAHARHAFDAARDRVADVVQLEIEEHLLAGADEFLREREPARKGELVADLVEHGGLAEPLDHRFRCGDGRQIERDDQALARINDHLSSRPSMRT